MLNKSCTYFQPRSFPSLCSDFFNESTERQMEGATPRFMSDSKQTLMGLEGRWWREDIAVKYLENNNFYFSPPLT